MRTGPEGILTDLLPPRQQAQRRTPWALSYFPMCWPFLDGENAEDWWVGYPGQHHPVYNACRLVYDSFNIVKMLMYNCCVFV